MVVEDIYPTIGEFALKVAAFEATIDDLLFQAANHFGQLFTERLDGFPKAFAEKVNAVLILASDFCGRPLPFSSSEFLDAKGFEVYVSELVNVRNALLHSSMFGFEMQSGDAEMSFHRVGNRGAKVAGGCEYKAIELTVQSSVIKEMLRKLEQAQIMLVLMIGCVSWQMPSWNEMELRRAKPLVFRNVDFGKRLSAFSKGQNPFEK